MEQTIKDSGVEWIGEIPKEWDTVRFKFMHKGSNVGLSIDREFWSTNENDTVFYTAGQKSIYTNYLDFDEEMLTKENDLLLARNGTPYVYFPKVGAIYTDHIIRVSIDANYDKAYIRYCLQQSIAKEVVDTVSIATWSVPIWNRQCLPHPSLHEQQSIAAYLDKKCAAIDGIIAEAKATIDEYKSWKASVIFEAVTKGLNQNAEMKDSGVEWIGKIPKHWGVVPLKRFYDNSHGSAVRVGPFGSALSGSDITSEGVWVYNQRAVLDNNFESNNTFVSPEKAKELANFGVFPKDILITTRGSIGKIAIVPDNAPYGILHPCIIRFRIDEQKVDKHLLKYIFNDTDLIKEQILYYSNSTTIDVLYSYTLKELKLPLIPKNEQVEIIAYLDEKCAAIDGVIAEKEALIGELESYKKSLIFETVTGKRRVAV